jgi:hypothetical protein
VIHIKEYVAKDSKEERKTQWNLAFACVDMSSKPGMFFRFD